jgi:hypothetical protein
MEPQAQWEKPAKKDPQEILEQKVQLENKVLLEKLVPKVLQDIKAIKGKPEPKDTQDHKVQLAPQAVLELMVQQVRQANRVF